MTVTFSGHKAFTGPKSFFVETKSVYQYPLTFSPQIEDDKFQGQMTINNTDTGFTQIYNLRGKSDRGPPVRSTSFCQLKFEFVSLRSVIYNWKAKWVQRK